MNKRLLIVVFLMLTSMLSALAGTAAAADSDIVCIHIESDATNTTPAGVLIIDVIVKSGITNEVVFERPFRTPAGTHNQIDAFIRVDSSILPVGFQNSTSYEPNDQTGQAFSAGSELHQVDFSQCDDGFGKISDGRINALDLAAPLAAYCTGDGSVAVWDIDDGGHGRLGFTSTAAEISKAVSDAQSSGQNVLVGQGLGNSLYAAANGQLFLTGPDVKEPGKAYTYIFAPDSCG